MRERKLIFVDGIKTREAVDRKAGRKRGMVEICKAAGVSQPVLSDICIKGYGTPKTIRKMQEAGIPIIFSPTPVPSRIARTYKKGKNREPVAEDIQKENAKKEPMLLPTGKTMKATVNFEKQISFEDYTGAAQMKDILIKGLTAIIEELKKI